MCVWNHLRNTHHRWSTYVIFRVRRRNPTLSKQNYRVSKGPLLQLPRRRCQSFEKMWHDAFTGGKSWPSLVVKLHVVQWSRRKTVRARFLIWLQCKRKTLVPFAYLGRWIIETMESSTISSKESGSRCNGRVLIAATRVCYCITSTLYIYIYKREEIALVVAI
jgi:hypothetical protein